MISRHWRGVRNRLAHLGLAKHRSSFSTTILGFQKDDIRGVDPQHGLEAGSESWSIHPVLESLERGEPLGFAHFNHGEVRCVLYGKHRTRDKVDMCSEVARELLSDSLRTLATTADQRVIERFLVGLPCPRCHGPKGPDLIRAYPGLRRLSRVPAMLFHHSLRWNRARLLAALKARNGPIYLVCSSEHDTEAISSLGLPLDGVLTVDRLAAPRDDPRYKRWVTEIAWDGGTRAPALLLCCGVVGRAWAVDAFTRRPDSVTLCLGSYFDDVALSRLMAYTMPGVRQVSQGALTRRAFELDFLVPLLLDSDPALNRPSPRPGSARVGFQTPRRRPGN
jgi:hypothetical protein